MADIYKLIGNDESEGVIKNNFKFIMNDLRNPDWKEYLQWKREGNLPLPRRTTEELIEIEKVNLLFKLKEELDKRVKESDPTITSNSRNRDRFLAKLLHTLRKEIKGNASPTEVAELDYLETIDDYQESLCDCFDTEEIYINSSERTLLELQSYDVINSPNWPKLK